MHNRHLNWPLSKPMVKCTLRLAAKGHYGSRMVICVNELHFSVNVIIQPVRAMFSVVQWQQLLQSKCRLTEAIRFASAVAAMKMHSGGRTSRNSNRAQTESFCHFMRKIANNYGEEVREYSMSIIEVTGNPRHDQLVHYDYRTRLYEYRRARTIAGRVHAKPCAGIFVS